MSSRPPPFAVPLVTASIGLAATAGCPSDLNDSANPALSAEQLSSLPITPWSGSIGRSFNPATDLQAESFSGPADIPLMPRLVLDLPSGPLLIRDGYPQPSLQFTEAELSIVHQVLSSYAEAFPGHVGTIDWVATRPMEIDPGMWGRAFWDAGEMNGVAIIVDGPESKDAGARRLTACCSAQQPHKHDTQAKVLSYEFSATLIHESWHVVHAMALTPQEKDDINLLYKLSFADDRPQAKAYGFLGGSPRQNNLAAYPDLDWVPYGATNAREDSACVAAAYFLDSPALMGEALDRAIAGYPWLLAKTINMSALVSREGLVYEAAMQDVHLGGLTLNPRQVVWNPDRLSLLGAELLHDGHEITGAVLDNAIITFSVGCPITDTARARLSGDR
ncbi:MAG: hypothetical protein QY326_01360 [Bdellovibrionota bacterium]|nr:MAG: hypothetical protein QY326_01360 [Bdellovibrionota bacterium]